MTAPSITAPGVPAAPEAAKAPPKPRPVLRFRGREIPVVLPTRKDLRLKLTAVIIVLQVLGQTILPFKVSIPQIVVTILVCGFIESALTYHRDGVLAWPASAFQTGNSIAFILRASGTRHGDYWSWHGIWYFVLAGVLGMASKYLIRIRGKHIFNPSNVGIVAILIVVGPNYTFSEHLWWGKPSLAVAVAATVVLLGGIWLLKPVRMWPMSLSFIGTFSVLVGLFALNGRSFYATWSHAPVGGVSYWVYVSLSPEIIAFVFFMMSDPQTAPKSQLGRVIYGVATAVVTAALLYFQTTEFGVKLAILASLCVVCALVPLIEHVSRRVHDRKLATPVMAPAEGGVNPLRLLGRLRSPAVAATVIIAVACFVDTAAVVNNKSVQYIERDLPPPGTVPATGAVVHNPHRQ